MIYPCLQEYASLSDYTCIQTHASGHNLGVKSLKFLVALKVSAGGVILNKVGPLLSTYFCM